MTDPELERPARVPAVVVRSGEGEAIPAAGVVHLFKLAGAQTGGRFGLEEFELPPQAMGARPHVHHSHDEYFYVLAGRLAVATEQGETTLAAGDLAAAPRGSVHGFRNPDRHTPARGLCMYTPSGYEQYFRDVHAAVESGLEPTAELLAGLRSRYDTESR